MSLRDVWFMLDGEPGGTWSLLDSLGRGVWPPLEGVGGRVSLREVFRRFERPGAELREMVAESGNVWRHVNKDRVVRELRNRVRDPAIMRQDPTDLCGPISLLMEFARRRPTRFVRGAAELLRDGAFTTPGGLKFEAAEELRELPVPPGDIAEVEWVYAATIRDDSNLIVDVDDGQGGDLEGVTWGSEMAYWTNQMLGLWGNYQSTFISGELEMLREAQRAVERGGVAFLLVEVDLIHNGDADDDHENNMRWRMRRHSPGAPLGDFGARHHSVDDNNVLPDHYVVLLGHLRGASSGRTDFRVRVWSFGNEYEITGAADAFCEYLWGVVTGVPDD